MKPITRLPSQAEIESEALKLIDTHGDQAKTAAYIAAAEQVNERESFYFELFYAAAQVLDSIAGPDANRLGA